MFNSNSNIYISPFTPSSQKLTTYIEKSYGIKVKGFIDSSKEGASVYNHSDIDKLSIDYILIFSPNWEDQIFMDLTQYLPEKNILVYKQKGTHFKPKNKFLYVLQLFKKNLPIYLANSLCTLFNIRITTLWTNRIGELSVRSEILLRSIQSSKKKTRYIILSTEPHEISNMYLYNLYKQAYKKCKYTFLIEDSYLIKLYKKVILHKKFNKKHTFKMENNNNELELFSNTSPIISLSSKDILEGKNILKKMGITKPFVCIYSRDDAYLNETFKDTDWSYHDYRNADIDSFNKTTRYLLEKDYCVIRIGNKVAKKCSLIHENFIDYPYTDYQSEFMDIFLIAQCAFVIGTTSGLIDLSIAFEKPRLGVNQIPVDHPPLGSKNNVLFIPKKLLLNGNYIGLTQYYKLLYKTKLHPQLLSTYKQLNLVIENNSDDEILALTKEYLNEFDISPKNIKQQKLYQKIHTQSKDYGIVNITIGHTFLESNPWFIDEKE